MLWSSAFEQQCYGLHFYMGYRKPFVENLEPFIVCLINPGGSLEISLALRLNMTPWKQRILQPGVDDLTLPFLSYGMLGKLLNIFNPQFPYL